MEDKLINMMLDNATTDGEKLNALDKLKRRLNGRELSVGSTIKSKENNIISERDLKKLLSERREMKETIRNLEEVRQNYLDLVTMIVDEKKALEEELERLKEDIKSSPDYTRLMEDCCFLCEDNESFEKENKKLKEELRKFKAEQDNKWFVKVGRVLSSIFKRK